MGHPKYVMFFFRKKKKIEQFVLLYFAVIGANGTDNHVDPGPEGYKTFSVLISAEHDIKMLISIKKIKKFNFF